MYIPKCFQTNITKQELIEKLKKMYNKDNKETQALQLQQTGVIKSVCKHCSNKLCDSQTFNQQCFKCGKKPQ